MLSRVFSGAILGIDAFIVEVEVDLSLGLPGLQMVGLPDNAVRESKERVRSAIKNTGVHLPSRRITVNLAPADIRKMGAAFDLPIAVGILAGNEVVQHERLTEYMVLGELALDGSVKPVPGALPIAVACREQGYRGVILPSDNAAEAAVVTGVEVIPVNSLLETIEFLNERRQILPMKAKAPQDDPPEAYRIDLQDVKGQEHVKRALEVAAAGGHNLLMIGPPGCGKTMMARRISSILPQMSFEESLETSKVYSVLGLLPRGKGLVNVRPFRAPHHTISDVGLIGGGTVPRPGEISLAHNGVLFLDELPEFRKYVLEVLRQPLEDNTVTITRSMMTLSYPASFMLVSAMNPCPCGYLGDPKKECSCSSMEIQRYRSRISGPLLDRIDLHIEVPAVKYQDLQETRRGESSAEIRARVEGARAMQAERLKDSGVFTNARMTSPMLRKHCPIDQEGSRLLEMVVDRLGMSARAYDRIIKVARTIADLEKSETIQAAHLSEAIQYRSLDRAVG